MKIVSVATMRTLDEATIAAGTPGDVLMERAGAGAAREILAFLHTRLAPRHRERLTVLAGKGNNGGDAQVVARRLAAALPDTPVTVYSVVPRTQLRGDARRHADRLPPGLPWLACQDLPAAALGPGAVVVDGLLGTGVSGPPQPPYDAWIRQVNASGLPVVALDIPSGLDGDTGAAPGEAIRADLTVTMGLPKRGLLTPAGRARCGILRLVDIGLEPGAVQNAPSAGEAVLAADIAPLLGRRPADAHKGTFGQVTVVGGSRLYTGAPALAAAAALRAGAGLATVALPDSVRTSVACPGLLAVIVRGLPDAGRGCLGPEAVEELDGLLARSQSVVVGPGLGRAAESAAVLRHVLQTSLPVVVDADGLFLLAGLGGSAARPAGTVLTPHPGEMRTLLSGLGLASWLEAGRPEQATALAKAAQACVVLKGMGTVVAAPDGRWAVNTTGTQGLASGGTGDVLAGLIGGLLAQGWSPWDAARAGVFAHGLAAELAPGGDRALVADDLLGLLGAAWRELSPLA